MQIMLDDPWMIADAGRPLRALSWALNRPGFSMARSVVWRIVRNADLPPDLDAQQWFQDELTSNGHADAIGFLTSRAFGRYNHATATVDGITANAIATTGLSNAERVGTRDTHTSLTGTINIAVSLSTGLTDGALVEALSIATQARTTAVLEHGPRLPWGQTTGTGTDCIAVLALPGAAPHAGLHTATGEAIGRAVLDCVAEGVKDWMQEQTKPGESHA